MKIVPKTMSYASKVNQLIDPDKGFRRMHRAGTYHMNVAGSLNTAAKKYDARRKSDTYFLDIVNGIAKSFNVEWG